MIEHNITFTISKYIKKTVIFRTNNSKHFDGRTDDGYMVEWRRWSATRRLNRPGPIIAENRMSYTGNR